MPTRESSEASIFALGCSGSAVFVLNWRN